MNVKSDLFYTKNDEWVAINGNTAIVGITDYAQNALSDIVFVEIVVSAGESINAADNIAIVESVKAASDVYSPVEGTVSETNDSVVNTPEKLNQDPFGSAWLIKLTNENGFETSGLMNADAYLKYCEERG